MFGIINLNLTTVSLTTEQRVFGVKEYYESRSFIEVREACRERFSNRDPPWVR